MNFNGIWASNSLKLFFPPHDVLLTHYFVYFFDLWVNLTLLSVIVSEIKMVFKNKRIVGTLPKSSISAEIPVLFIPCLGFSHL